MRLVGIKLSYGFVPSSIFYLFVWNWQSTLYVFSTVAFWDTRKGSQPVEMSSIDHSHHDPVYRVRFLASKSGNS